MSYFMSYFMSYSERHVAHRSAACPMAAMQATRWEVVVHDMMLPFVCAPGPAPECGTETSRLPTQSTFVAGSVSRKDSHQRAAT